VKRATAQAISPSAAALESGDSTEVVLRAPRRSDGLAIHRLIAECPPLDLNSVYTYLLLSEHFSGTCVAAETCSGLVGFASGYIPPAQPEVLFVWQVAVHCDARGQGLGLRMLENLVMRQGSGAVRYVETTVGPQNTASRRMFAALAHRLNAPSKENLLFPHELFGAEAHDDERLIRIGPFGRQLKPKEV